MSHVEVKCACRYVCEIAELFFSSFSKEFRVVSVLESA
jgi:hypothetical protein